MNRTMQRLRIEIGGLVQGVGFRPHVYHTASRLALTGWVKNHAYGVLIEVQGRQTSDFLPRLTAAPPPLARIDMVRTSLIAVDADETTFSIRESEPGPVNTIISPDTSICPDCLSELFDPASRYYLYPFLNCTHCGPRLTVTQRLPYDRRHTSMADFPLCTDCRRDYDHPGDRRYHAQATACAACGPRYTSAIEEIARQIAAGNIAAVKGLGGYQLICDARNEDAVTRLRERKNREAKPFALMLLNLRSADRIVKLIAGAEELLTGKERPIVLLPMKEATLCAGIAPELSHYGVMLPSTPLHYLLFHAISGKPAGKTWLDEANTIVLVVTSANPGGDPLVIDDDSARLELVDIADCIIAHDRKIVCRTDDSVMQIINQAPVFIRRARGFVPVPVKLPHPVPVTLAAGAHLKNTFCLTRGDEAFISQHIGSLNNKATIEFFHETLAHFMRFLDVKPERIAHDMHPDFYTTRFAQAYGIPAYSVQHHHAHLAAVAAEHHVMQPAIGLALDGYGYGLNGGAWGGELLLLDDTTCTRLGCLTPLPQPGGEIAAREPWRMAAAVMHLLGRSEEIAMRFPFPAAGLLTSILEKRIHTPLTSSCGRLFDAASSLLGVNHISRYEGQAAMQLESLVTLPQVLPDGWNMQDGCLNLLPILSRLPDMDPVSGANLFHGSLIAGLSEWAAVAAGKLSIDVVLLSGGCFLNKTLTEGLIAALSSQGLTVLLSCKVPPNDGGIALGQAWIAGRI